MANVVFLVILSKFFFIIENKAVGTSLKIPVIAPRPHLKMRAIAPLLRGLWRPLAALSLAASALFKLSVRVEEIMSNDSMSFT